MLKYRKTNIKCKHHRDPASCCTCAYGDIERSAPLQDRAKDLIEELKKPIGDKLKEGWDIIKRDED